MLDILQTPYSLGRSSNSKTNNSDAPRSLSKYTLATILEHIISILIL